MKLRCPVCSTRGVPLAAKFFSRPSNPSQCLSCGAHVASVKPVWAQILVAFVEQPLALVAVFASFLAWSNPWWILLVVAMFLPAITLDILAPIQAISGARQQTEQTRERVALKVLGILFGIAILVGIAGALAR
jgi:hypothetical protein